MAKKVFISINLTSQEKKNILKKISIWRDLPIKWTKEKNLHVTLLYLGHVEDELIVEVCKKMRMVAENEKTFVIQFDAIELNSENNPKMIWISGCPNEKLKRIHYLIQKELGIFEVEKKSFCPHITLGRIRKQKWENLSKAPEIYEKYQLNVSVESIDIMASDFNGNTQEYSLVESCQLK